MSLRSRSYGWYALGLLTVANFLHYGNRNILFPMHDDLRGVFGFSNYELGLLGSAFMITHAPITLLIGWAGDRFDRRRILALGMLVWSVAGVASAAASSFGMLFLSRAFVGMGTAACVPVANALLCEIFPAERKAMTISIFSLGLFFGGAGGFAIGASLGYPGGVLLMALPGVVLALLVVQLDVPAYRIREEDAERLSFGEFVSHAVALLRVPTLRWVILATSLMAFGAGGYATWFFDFISVTKGMGPDRALVLFGLTFVAGLLGIIAGGAVADRLQARRSYGRLAAISLGMGLCVPLSLLSIYVEVGVVFYVTSWLTMFFIMWYHGPMAAVVDDLAKDDRATTAQALVIFTMHFVGTMPSSVVVGKLADLYGLREALLAPTAAILIAAIVLIGGWRTVGADAEAARG